MNSQSLIDIARTLVGSGGDHRPSQSCIEANAHALARYAALCQEVGLVPVVESEVLMDGDHTLEQCREVTEHCLQIAFEQLRSQRVLLEGMILKPNMVLPGLTCPHKETVNEVAVATVKCLLEVVPAAVPGIAFLSGGPIGRARVGPLKRHAFEKQTGFVTPVGTDFFFWSGDSAAGVGNLGRGGIAPRCGAASAAASGTL